MAVSWPMIPAFAINCGHQKIQNKFEVLEELSARKQGLK